MDAVGAHERLYPRERSIYGPERNSEGLIRFSAAPRYQNPYVCPRSSSRPLAAEPDGVRLRATASPFRLSLRGAFSSAEFPPRSGPQAHYRIGLCNRHRRPRLAGFETGIGAAQFARALNQTQLEELAVWNNPKTKKYEPPSKSVIHRVPGMADPAANKTVLKRWSTPRLKFGSALAADDKRLRSANRNGDGYFETATLDEHDTALPVARHGFHDKSGERAAVRALLEEVSLAGRGITLDVLHTTRDTARCIVE